VAGQIQSWREAKSGQEVLLAHVDALKDLVSQLDLGMVERVGELLYEVTQRGGCIYTVGNGGSAATALHIAADLSWGRRTGNEKRPKALSLVSNTPVMTALANDVSYEDIFVEQLKNFFNTGDVVVAISASGNSENVLRAVEFANQNGGTSVGMTGFDGGKLKSKSQLDIHVPTPTGEYELVEDVHHSVCHMLANYLKYQDAVRSAKHGKSSK